MFHLIIGFIYFVRLWSSWRVGGVPLGRRPSTLGYFALYPWVVAGVSLGTSCLLLACLLLVLCLPGRGTPCLYGEVAFPRVAAWSLYRVGSLLGPPRYGLLWWGRSFIHRPKVNLPARRICPRRDVWLFVRVSFVCLGACKVSAPWRVLSCYRMTLWLRLAQERMLMVTARLFTSSSQLVVTSGMVGEPSSRAPVTVMSYQLLRTMP